MSIISGDDYITLVESVNPYSLKNSLRQSKQLLISGIQPEIDLQQYEGKDSQIEDIINESNSKKEIVREKQTNLSQQSQVVSEEAQNVKSSEQQQAEQAIKEAQQDTLDKIYNQTEQKDRQQVNIDGAEQIQQLTLANTHSDENKTLSRLAKLADKLNLKIMGQEEQKNEDNEQELDNQITEKKLEELHEQKTDTISTQQLSPKLISTTDQPEQKIQISLSPMQENKVQHQPVQPPKDNNPIINQQTIYQQTNNTSNVQEQLIMAQTQQISSLQYTIQQKEFQIQELQTKQSNLETLIQNLQIQFNQLQNERIQQQIQSTIPISSIKPQQHSINFDANISFPKQIDIQQTISSKKKNIFTSIIKPQINPFIPACVIYDYQNNDNQWSREYQQHQREMLEFSEQILDFKLSNQRVALQKVKVQKQKTDIEQKINELDQNQIQQSPSQTKTAKQKSLVDKIIAKNQRITSRCKNFDTSQLEYCDVQNKTANGQLQPSITKYDLVDYDNIITSIGEIQL